MHAAAWMLVPGLMAMAMMGNLQAIASGKGRLRQLNIFIALSGPLQALWLYFWIDGGLQGLAPGILLFGIVALPLALWLMPPFPLQFPRRAQWKEQARLWAPLAAMGSVVAVLSPYKLILFRETILAQGVDVAGNWQAAVRITDLLFATWSMAFTTWALPRLSGPEENRPKFGKLLFGPLGGLALGISIAVAAPWILDLAYVGRFPGALPVLRLQCIAEFVQSCTMPLGLILIARRSAKVFTGLELAGAIVQIALVRILVPHLGPIGAPIAICIESTAYFAVALWFVRRKGPVQE
jgi:PST family polysaccharide transporter